MPNDRENFLLSGSSSFPDLYRGDCQVFDSRGEFLRSFKDFDTILSCSFLPSGELLNVPYALGGKRDPFYESIGIYNCEGRLLKRYEFRCSVDFPDFNLGQVPRPLVIGDEYVVVNAFFPVVRRFTLDGDIANEFEILDSRLRMKAAANRLRREEGGMQSLIGQQIFSGVGPGGGIVEYEGDYLLSVKLDTPGIEFIRFNDYGQVVENLFYNTEKKVHVLDFVVLNKEDSTAIACIASAESKNPVLILEAVDESPRENLESQK